MELIRSWILSVAVSAMMIAVAEALMPPGAVRRVAKLTGGLVLMLAILQPLLRLDYDELYLAANAGAQMRVEYAAKEQLSDEFLKGIIEEELCAYVLDKAQSFGASCAVSVICEPGENGVPTPAQATVEGLSDAEQERKMRLLLRDELGIPYERQTYISEETP